MILVKINQRPGAKQENRDRPGDEDQLSENGITGHWC